MSYVDFFNYAYLNINIFLALSFILFIIMFISLRRFAIAGVLDPFHFTYTFTYSTSYSVVILLYIGGYISGYHFIIVVLYAVIFILCLKYLQSVKLIGIFGKLYNTLAPTKLENVYCTIIIIIYLFLVTTVLTIKGFSLFTDINRFEDNRGIGPLVKILNLLTYFLISYISIEIYKKKESRKSYFYFSGLIVFMIFNAMLSGAKSALLFYFMAYILSLSIFSGKFRLSPFKIFLILLFSLIFVFIVLAFNFSKVLDLSVDNIRLLFESLFRRFMDRILSNGDSYYMGLPYDVIENVELNNILIVFFTPLISSSLMSKLAGYDVTLLDLGKQFLLNLYPDMERAGGPTDHFDLFAYKYFGVLGGGGFIVFLAFWLSQIRKLLTISQGSPYKSSLAVVLWISCLTVLLKPAMLLGDIVIFAFLFIIIKFIGDCIVVICSRRKKL